MRARGEAVLGSDGSRASSSGMGLGWDEDDGREGAAGLVRLLAESGSLELLRRPERILYDG